MHGFCSAVIKGADGYAAEQKYKCGSAAINRHIGASKAGRKHTISNQ